MKWNFYNLEGNVVKRKSKIKQLRKFPHQNLNFRIFLLIKAGEVLTSHIAGMVQ